MLFCIFYTQTETPAGQRSTRGYHNMAWKSYNCYRSHFPKGRNFLRFFSKSPRPNPHRVMMMIRCGRCPTPPHSPTSTSPATPSASPPSPLPSSSSPTSSSLSSPLSASSSSFLPSLSYPACCQEKNVLCTFWCVYTTADLSQDDVLANISFLLLDFVLSPVSLLNHNRKFRWKLINPLAPHFHFVNNYKQQIHKSYLKKVLLLLDLFTVCLPCLAHCQVRVRNVKMDKVWFSIRSPTPIYICLPATPSSENV